jgi:hypothetical protein
VKRKTRGARRNPAGGQSIAAIVRERCRAAQWRGGETGDQKNELKQLDALATAVLDEVGDEPETWADLSNHSIDEMALLPYYTQRTAFYRKHEDAIFYLVMDYGQELNMKWTDMLDVPGRGSDSVYDAASFHSRMVSIIFEVLARAVSDAQEGE